MHNRIFSKSVILNTSEHRSTIKALLVGTLQQELQVTSRQILGGLPQSLATLRLNLLFVPRSPTCIKRWRFLARFLSSFAASRTCRFKSERRWRRSAISWCSRAWPAHESCTMSKMLVSCAFFFSWIAAWLYVSIVRAVALLSEKCWYHVQVHIETTCFCCISELTQSAPQNSFEPRQRYANVRNSPNLLCAAAPLSSPENTIKIVHFDPVLPGSWPYVSHSIGYAGKEKGINPSSCQQKKIHLSATGSNPWRAYAQHFPPGERWDVCVMPSVTGPVFYLFWNSLQWLQDISLHFIHTCQRYRRRLFPVEENMRVLTDHVPCSLGNAGKKKGASFHRLTISFPGKASCGLVCFWCVAVFWWFCFWLGCFLLSCIVSTSPFSDKTSESTNDSLS